VSLGDRGIATSEDEKTMAAGAQMWNSEMFTEDQMVARENKTVAQQTWAVFQIRGPAGEFPANIFEPGKMSE